VVDVVILLLMVHMIVLFATAQCKAYNSQNALFVLYCWMHDKEVLTEDACTNLEALQVQFGSVTEEKKQKLLWKATLLLLNGNLCPLHLHLVTGQRLLRYLLLLLNSAGKCLLASAYSNKCAALFHLFKFFGEWQTQTLQADLKVAMASLKRMVAVEKQKGDG